MNDVTKRCRTSNTDGPRSHSAQFPCCGFSGSLPTVRIPLPLSNDFDNVYDTRPDNPFDNRRVNFAASEL